MSEMSTQEWREQNQDKLRKYRRDWYERNKQRQKAYKIRRDAENRAWFRDFKGRLACERCGEDHPATLDFHHRNPAEKDRNLSHVIQHGWSRERIRKELDKCDVLCSNCHRKEHASAAGQT